MHLEARQHTASLLAESSINEPPLSHDVSSHPEASLVTYHLVEKGRKGRKMMLVDSLGFCLGFTYNVNLMQLTGNTCKASETKRDGTFHAGKNPHNHAAEVVAVTVKIVTSVKEMALEDKSKPAAAIVNEAIIPLQ